MPRISDLFPSKYLKASDLADIDRQGRVTPKPGLRLPVNVKIDRIEQEDVGAEGKREVKPILYFVGKDKGLVLNKTNADELALLLGDDDTDSWPGRVVGLTVQRVRFKNDMVPALRIVAAVRVQMLQPQQSPRPAAAPAAAAPARAARRAEPEPDPDPDPDFGDAYDAHDPADNVADGYDDDIPF